MHTPKAVSIGNLVGIAMVLIITQIFAQAVSAPSLNAAELTKVVLVEGPGFFTGTPTVFAAQTGIFKKHAVSQFL